LGPTSGRHSRVRARTDSRTDEFRQSCSFDPSCGRSAVSQPFLNRFDRVRSLACVLFHKAA
jgi:hypothetical protein